MAKITLLVDDLDNDVTGDGVNTYLLVDPDTGDTYSIDLGEENYERLTDALAPFIAVARRLGAGPSTSASRSSARASSTPDYDKDALKAWAEPLGKWTGKRPSHALINEFLDS